jgi:3',5'-cyclic AMP phosphodiesterase CpdA
MQVIHFGDIHVWDLKIAWTDLFYLKRWLGGANLLLNRRKKFPPDFGPSVVEEILKQDADLVVFSGDMTTTSLRSEFTRCAELFAPLREKWGDRFFVIPGNHDRYTPRSVKTQLYEKAFPYGVMDPETHLRTLELDPNWVVIGVDCSEPFAIMSNGLLTNAHAETLEACLKQHRDAGKNIILTGHFPYAYPPGIVPATHHVLINADRLEDLIAEYQPVIYLHGHKHIRWLMNPPTTVHTACINCGPAGMTSHHPASRAGFVRFNLGPSGKLERVFAIQREDEKSTFEEQWVWKAES